MAKRSFWNIDPKHRSALGAALSGTNELFHPQAKQAHEIQEEQKQRAVDLGSDGDPMKITIKRRPAKPKD
jgi:hypothetical protein